MSDANPFNPFKIFGAGACADPEVQLRALAAIQAWTRMEGIVQDVLNDLSTQEDDAGVFIYLSPDEQSTNCAHGPLLVPKKVLVLFLAELQALHDSNCKVQLSNLLKGRWPSDGPVLAPEQSK